MGDMTSIASASHGRWYTRTVDDPITGVPDESPAVAGAVDMASTREFYDWNTPAGAGLTSTPIVALPYNSWPPVNPQPDTLYLRMAP
jgi:hypothetical protein